MDRCCCGRIEDFTEPVIMNDRMHERLGDPGAFCGPVYKHDIRDLTADNERLRQKSEDDDDEIMALKTALKNLQPGSVFDTSEGDAK